MLVIVLDVVIRLRTKTCLFSSRNFNILVRRTLKKNANQKQKILRRGGKNTQTNCPKKIFTTKIFTMV